MSDKKWEYCVLEWLRFNVEPVAREANGEAKDAKEQTIALFGIRYANAQGKTTNEVLHTITTKNVNDKSKTASFIQIMGLLGGGGWELININQEPDRMERCTISSAYFKRVVIAGRNVDEPKIELA